MKKLKDWEGTIAVIGIDFGDSGKGRLVDDLAQRADIVARYAGGANTGHTVKNAFGNFALHIIPSGIFNKKAFCLVGRNVAVSLESLFAEIENLQKVGVSINNLVIDEGATITMPWHILRDNLREKLRNSKIGTTKSGIGPTYADRTERVGLRIKDLIDPDFGDKLHQELKVQNKFFNLKLNFNQIYKQYKEFAKKIKPLVGSTVAIVKKAKQDKKNILFEGAQGYFLDIDAGTYPYVTSSNPGVLGIWRSFDLHPTEIDRVVGITKAYITRVGAGPLPTKVTDPIRNFLITKGQEFGTTTGRKRDPGWLDLVLLNEAVRANKITDIAITKLDVLSTLKELKVAVGYLQDGKNVDYISGDEDFLEKVKPVYESLPGWEEDLSSIRDLKNLPQNAQNFIREIEEFLKVNVTFISVGPNRGEVIYV